MQGNLWHPSGCFSPESPLLALRQKPANFTIFPNLLPQIDGSVEGGRKATVEDGRAQAGAGFGICPASLGPEKTPSYVVLTETDL